jgi:hypothetical protein
MSQHYARHIHSTSRGTVCPATSCLISLPAKQTHAGQGKFPGVTRAHNLHRPAALAADRLRAHTCQQRCTKLTKLLLCCRRNKEAVYKFSQVFQQDAGQADIYEGTTAALVCIVVWHAFAEAVAIAAPAPLSGSACSGHVRRYHSNFPEPSGIGPVLLPSGSSSYDSLI